MNQHQALCRRVIEKNFKNLNAPQLEAVTTTLGPVLVLAGAGSGKTTVLVNRILCLIRYGNAYNDENLTLSDYDIAAAEKYLSGETEEIPVLCLPGCARPWEILAITFTNKAAGEMCERIGRVLGPDGEGVVAGTFHSVAARILRRHSDRLGFTSHFTIYDTDDQRRLVKGIMKDKDIDDKMLPVRTVGSEISQAKTEAVNPEEYLEANRVDPRKRLVADIYAEYEARLKAANAMDFDDLLLNLCRLFEENADVLDYYQNRFKYILVDEYQDTNMVQYRIVRALAGKRANLCVVGDDDQSIYRFRGATIENILSFEKQYPAARVIRLEENYRSSGNILDAANQVILNNKGRKGKTLWTQAGAGEKIKVYSASDEQDEARYVADAIMENVKNGQSFSSHAVLYRMNAQSNAIENAFARSGIKYRVIGGNRFYDRKEIKDAVAYLNVIANKNDRIRLMRIINEPKRGIGDTTIKAIQEISDQLSIPVFEVMENAKDYPRLARAEAKLKEFCNLINDLEKLAGQVSVNELLIETLARSGYMAALLAAGNEEADRVDNLHELSSSVLKYQEDSEDPTLTGFLEEVALISDIDNYDTSEDAAVMMTMHSAKGLEFDNVFVVGAEEGIFPGAMTILAPPEEMEEERRLAYVAITRARKVLHITHAQSRMIYGKTDRYPASRFLKEIPSTLVSRTASKLSGGNFVQFGYSSGKSAYSSGGLGSFGGANRFAAKPQTQSQGGQSFSAGDQVRHPVFKEGIVLKATRMGSDTLLEIAFAGVGTKRIMANFAKLEKIQ